MGKIIGKCGVAELGKVDKSVRGEIAKPVSSNEQKVVNRTTDYRLQTTDYRKNSRRR